MVAGWRVGGADEYFTYDWYVKGNRAQNNFTSIRSPRATIIVRARCVYFIETPKNVEIYWQPFLCMHKQRTSTQDISLAETFVYL